MDSRDDSYLDDVLGRARGGSPSMTSVPSPARASASPGYDRDDEYLQSVLSSARQSSEPSMLSKAGHVVGTVLGAPKAGIDYLARAGARAQGLNVPDTATTGSMMRNALGFNQGYETSGYGGKLGGKAVELATDVATDPVTWAMGGLGKAAEGGKVAENVLKGLGEEAIAPAARSALEGAASAGRVARPVQKAASAAFAGTMGLGAVDEAGRLKETVQKEGFTPQAAEEALGVAVGGLGAVGGLAHFKGGGRVGPGELEGLQGKLGQMAPDELQRRQQWYERTGRPELAQAVKAETVKRYESQQQGPPAPPPFPEQPFELPQEPAQPFTAPEGPIQDTFIGETPPETQPQLPIEPVIEQMGAPEGPPRLAGRAAVRYSPHADLARRTSDAIPESLDKTLEASLGWPAGEPRLGTGTPNPLPLPEKAPVETGFEMLPEPEQAPAAPIPAPAPIQEPVRRGRGAEPPKDAQGNRILPGQENWTPEERAIVHGAAEADVANVLASERFAPTGRHPYIREGAEGTRSITGGDFYGVKSAKNGTALENLPYGPKEMAEALQRDKGNPIELAIHDAVRHSEPVVEALENGSDSAEPSGPVDTSFDPAAFEAPKKPLPFPSPERSSERVALESEIMRQRPKIDRGLLRAALDDVESGKRELEPTVKALLAMDQRTGPAPFRGWEGHLNDPNAEQPSSLPPEKQAALRGVVEGAAPEDAGWIGETNAAAKVAQEAEARRQAIADASKAEKQAGYDAAAEELAPTGTEPRYSAQSVQEGPPSQPAATRESIEQRFKKHAKSILTEQDGALRLKFKDGLGDLVFRPDSMIEYDPVAFKRTYGREMYPSERILGSAQTIGPDQVIKLRTGAGLKTIGHEELHAVLAAGRLKPYEVDALWRDHGYDPRRFKTSEEAEKAFRETEEKVADTLGQHIEDRVKAEQEGRSIRQPEWFERLWAHLTRLWSALTQRTSTEAVKERIASGEVYQPAGLLERGAEKIGAALRPTRLLPEAETPRYSAVGGEVPPETPIPPTAGPRSAPIPDRPELSEKPSLMDKAIEYQKAGFVSAPPTHIANVASVGAEAGTKVFESLIASGVDRLLGGPRTRFASEAAAQIRGGAKQIPAMFGTFAKGIKDVLNTEGAIGGKAGKVIRSPFELLSLEDRATSETTKGSVAAQLAAREASRTGMSPEARDAYEQNLLQNPTEEMLREVSRRQFKGGKIEGDAPNPDSMIQNLVKFRSKHKWMHFIAPFIETPGNIAKIAVERSPAGYVKAARAWRAWKAAESRGAAPDVLARLKGEAVDHIASATMGTAMLGGFAALAKSGGMTGSGPDDPRLKAQWLETGKQPYSFVVPMGNGKNAYVPFNRFEPVSSILGIAADIAEMKDQKSGEEMANKFIGSIVSNFSSKTYLRGLADAAEFVNSPTKMAGKYLSSMAGTVVPNIVARATTAIDPVSRDVTPASPGLAGVPERIGNTLLSRIPGASTMLPARRSSTGEAIERPGNALSRFVSPVQISEDKPDAELERVMGAAGIAPSQPSRSFPIPNSKGKTMRLSQAEYAVVQRANEDAANILRTKVGSLRRMDPIEAKKQVEQVYNDAREKARARLMQNSAFRSRLRQEMTQ